jgi:hypothetical protein
VEFGRGRRFDRAFRQMIERQSDLPRRLDEAALVNLLDCFIPQERLPDGKTVVEHFIAAHPELSAEDRALLLGWRDAVESIFEVRGQHGEAREALNLVDDLTYAIRSNVGPAVFASLRRGDFLITRLIPLADEWLMSGVARILPAKQRADAYRMAVALAARQPALVFRNPATLARAWELEHAERQHFVNFFGSDLVVLPAAEADQCMHEYARYRMYEARDAEGKTAAEGLRERHGAAPNHLDYAPPDDLCDAETIGVVYDEVDGLNYLADFGLVEETFADPALAADAGHRDAVLSYLTDPSISPRLIQRLADRDLERATAVFRRVLKQRGFSWERDGETLLKEHKADYYAHPVLPSVVPVSDTLARAQLGAANAAGARPAQRPPARKSSTASRRKSGGSKRGRR